MHKFYDILLSTWHEQVCVLHWIYNDFGNVIFLTLGITSHKNKCILYNQRDATYAVFFIIISALHVLGGLSAHHQELIKLYVQPWILTCFPAVYRWCGWVGTPAVDSRKVWQYPRL
jgi:hypothetical protein